MLECTRGCYAIVLSMPIAYHALSVTVLATHGQVKPEEIAVDHVDVASLRTAESVDTTVEGFVRADLNSDSGVFAVH